MLVENAGTVGRSEIKRINSLDDGAGNLKTVQSNSGL